MSRIPGRGSVGRFGILAAAIAASAGLLGGGVASATADHKAAPTSSSAKAPVNDKQIPNLGKVKTEIEAYYGDHVVDGEHFASADSNYAEQVYGIERRAKVYLRTHATPGDGKPALVFDVDDTTLLTYNYELENDFGFDPVTNDAYVRAEKMRAVFGMPALINWADSEGYTVFFVTGRPEAQRDATAGNLEKAGYEVSAGENRLFLKNADNPPPYLTCGSDCTTIQYKSQTRAHIESLGYHIVGNFGDQFSDLEGGHADRRYKMPNPMYFLP